MDTADCTGCKTAPDAELTGWVLESSERGTLELIRSCLFTTFLCTWVVIHPRVYKRRLLGRLHKFALFVKTIIAPEFIAVEGLQEWSQAKKMVKNCEKATDGGLKLIHAFYISMLGLRYRTPQGEKVIWPNQYTWLLQEGLIDWKDHASWGLSEELICDKSDADSLMKLVALGQVSWFVIQSIIRTAHALPLSQLETMTLSYIPLFAITYAFWWVKPKDIMTPSVVELPDILPEQKAIFESMAVSSSFDDESIERQGVLSNILSLTPRVFEKEAADKAQEEEYLTVMQQDCQQHHDDRSPHADFKGPPKETVLAHWDPDLYRSKLWPVTCLFGVSFGALHLISWNAVFPTHVELWLWRVAALVSIVSMLIFMHFEKVVLRWGGPLTLISLISPVVYLISRLVMLGGVIAALRASDPAVYETFVISNYWIHIF